MNITIEIKRFNPETDDTPHFQKFKVEVKPTDRLLDALMNIKRSQDPTLGLRKSCAHGVCGSDAMVINGQERLPDLDYPDGVWPCENHFRCTRVCPRSIPVTKLINLTKMKISQFRKDRGEKIHSGSSS